MVHWKLFSTLSILFIIQSCVLSELMLSGTLIFRNYHWNLSFPKLDGWSNIILWYKVPHILSSLLHWLQELKLFPGFCALTIFRRHGNLMDIIWGIWWPFCQIHKFNCSFIHHFQRASNMNVKMPIFIIKNRKYSSV